MKHAPGYLVLLFSIIVPGLTVHAQQFTRTQLPTTLESPWEITYGPDNHLWLTESNGRVSRVDPVSGNKSVIFTAPDYFAGSDLENNTACNLTMGTGTFGLALHPDFQNPDSAFVYFLYSYNSGSQNAPATKFKVRRLKWSAAQQQVTENVDLITMLPSGFDHLGGRVMAVKRNGKNYLFVSIGDNGASEDNSPTCYTPQSTNPNNQAQNPLTKNGKIHRFNMNGSVPSDNPLAGNSMYTRGHRNPQGLIYNPVKDILYDVEHGDRTDDEINVLEGGKNYGWKYVRGYHGDNNYPGEAAYVANYSPYPGIANDGLKEPLATWCSVPQPGFAPDQWCTVAPSDGIYYGSPAITQWTNSLLVVTLKDGTNVRRGVHQFKLNEAGTALQDTPALYFADDHDKNGRLRDIAVSPDGKKIYLINNGGSPTGDRITVYEQNTSSVTETGYNPSLISIFPNPGEDRLQITGAKEQSVVEFYSVMGSLAASETLSGNTVSTAALSHGCYVVKVIAVDGGIKMLSWIKK
ncbi:MAG: PQQ-dependent sugar dehydrogenase [Bacteroidota bacterium]